MNAPPFFIVGCGRSGTTLLRGVLDRHPDVGIPLESLFVVDYLRAARSRSVEELVPLLVAEPEVREWGLNITLEDLVGTRDVVEAIERLHTLYVQRRGKSRWGQKTPRFIRYLSLISEAFPGARFIHLVRDPRAVTSSLIRSDVHNSNALYAARRWRHDVTAGLAFEKRRPAQVLRVYYEELVSDPVDSLKEICKFLEVEYDPSLVAGGAAGTEEYSEFYDQIHANLDAALTDEFVDRWRENLADREVALVEWLTADLMDELGYQRVTEIRPPAPIYLIWLRVQRGAGMLAQLAKYWRQRRSYLLHTLRRKWRLGLMKDLIWIANY